MVPPGEVPEDQGWVCYGADGRRFGRGESHRQPQQHQLLRQQDAARVGFFFMFFEIRIYGNLHFGLFLVNDLQTIRFFLAYVSDDLKTKIKDAYKKKSEKNIRIFFRKS